MTKPQIRDSWRDPVAAYDLIAPIFPILSDHRRRYLDAIDEMVLARISLENDSLLDVGAGNGGRAAKIAARTKISRVVLLEPSISMSGGAEEKGEIWRLRAENLDISKISSRFQVITCLWNVLGHIPGVESRKQVLTRLRQLLKPGGRIFLDVNHRYNARAYGWIRSGLRLAYDQLWPSDENGDVVARWSVGSIDCSTYGHVFTAKEVSRLVTAAGLKIDESIAVDYSTGELTRFDCQGNLFYVLRP